MEMMQSTSCWVFPARKNKRNWCVFYHACSWLSRLLALAREAKNRGRGVCITETAKIKLPGSNISLAHTYYLHFTTITIRLIKIDGAFPLFIDDQRSCEKE